MDSLRDTSMTSSDQKSNNSESRATSKKAYYYNQLSKLIVRLWRQLEKYLICKTIVDEIVDVGNLGNYYVMLDIVKRILLVDMDSLLDYMYRFGLIDTLRLVIVRLCTIAMLAREVDVTIGLERYSYEPYRYGDIVLQLRNRIIYMLLNSLIYRMNDPLFLKACTLFYDGDLENAVRLFLMFIGSIVNISIDVSEICDNIGISSQVIERGSQQEGSGETD